MISFKRIQFKRQQMNDEHKRTQAKLSTQRTSRLSGPCDKWHKLDHAAFFVYSPKRNTSITPIRVRLFPVQLKRKHYSLSIVLNR